MKKNKAVPEPITFRTVEEITAAATPENVHRLAQDFYAFLQYVVAAKIICSGTTSPAMTWTDDGEHEITRLNVEMKHPKRK
jgi:hypothetical protein